MHSRYRLGSISVLLMMLLSVGGASAEPVLSPGQTHAFQQADGGTRECRNGDFQANCDNPKWLNTGHNGTHRVEASIDPVEPVGLGIPNHASASLYNDFSLDGDEDTFVEARFSVTWDYDGFLQGSAAYAVETGLSLKVADITNGSGANSVSLGSATLTAQERSADQGIELGIAAGAQTSSLRGEASGFSMLLRRGRTYRLSFEASAVLSVLVVGTPSVHAHGKWSDLRVAVDNDVVKQLELHDAQVKSAIADHDDDIKDAVAAHDVEVKEDIAVHDADIKALLSNIQEGQVEIIRLLLTPQGLRSSDFGDCADEGCAFPVKPDPGPHGGRKR